MTGLRREHAARVLNARESLENLPSTWPVLAEPKPAPDGQFYLGLASGLGLSAIAWGLFLWIVGVI